jgi:hypothetical protein
VKESDVVMRVPMHWRLIFALFWAPFFAATPCAFAQDLLPDPTAQSTLSLSPPSVSEKWKFFVDETVTPLTLVAASLDATVSQLTRSAPLYGKHPWKRGAFPKRFGATVGDDVSQNFFADFVLASVLHEDTRYVRKGPVKGAWSRLGYAISRAVVTRTDAGAPTFNYANVAGCAMSAGLSNAYYPPVSRTLSDSLTNWGTNVAGAGLTNLAPEFGPDVARFFKRHIPFLRR